MRNPLSLMLVSVACVLGFAFPGKAGSIYFDNNPIDFTPPAITSGDGTLSVSGPVPATGTPLSNGIEIDELDFTVTANSLAPITVEWTATRAFQVLGDPAITVTLIGSTIASISDKGTATITGRGFLNGAIAVMQPIMVAGPTMAGGKGVTFNMASAPQVVNGPFSTSEDYITSFKAAAIGETFSASSYYIVTVSVVPEPSSLLLLTAGFFVVFLFVKGPGRGMPSPGG